MRLSVKIGARDSQLSRAQVDEIFQELKAFHPDVQFEPMWLKTTGDHDLKTSLRMLDKTDFFTKELDEKLLAGEIDIAIHSAKDLPEPLYCEAVKFCVLTASKPLESHSCERVNIELNMDPLARDDSRELSR